jgi:hypothetical protein
MSAAGAQVSEVTFADDLSRIHNGSSTQVMVICATSHLTRTVTRHFKRIGIVRLDDTLPSPDTLTRG